jgi:hypothetical protein
MRRILLAILLMAVAGLAFVGVRSWCEKRAQRKREAAYESILRSYTQVLRPGMTRREVEDYLGTKSIKFQQMCCLEGQDLDPTKRGFGGDYPGTNPVDEVGPFDERGQTIRQLLVKIVSASRGATWCPTQNVQSPAPATVNGFWTLVTYSGNWASRPQ